MNVQLNDPIRIPNRQARALWLNTNRLSSTPTGAVDVMAMIRALGFVQIDTIRNVTRCHHHILWSRNTNYREKMLWPLLGKKRAIFEHFTHDASLIETAERTWYPCLAPSDIETRLANLPDPTSRLRILNPFDPAIRDRNRTRRLFGFDYVNEMSVPAAKRRWGYYVYPLLEQDRFVGRLEIKADRAKNQMQITGFWPEPKVKWTPNRHAKLAAELTRFARLAGITNITWSTDRT